MIDDLTTTGVGVAVVAVVLILRTVFEFLEKMEKRKATKAGDPGCFSQRDRERLNKLYEWHDRTDSDGVPVWYVRSSLETSVEKLSEAIAELSRSNEAQVHLLETLCREVRTRRRARTEDGS